MLPSWENRPEITANLINPAFCSEIIRESAAAYNVETQMNFPFVLSVLILPLILNSKIRNQIPKTKANTIHSWINKNEKLKIGLAPYIKSFLPFTKESLMFGIRHKSFDFDINGNIQVIKKSKKLVYSNVEILEYIKKANVLGKILSKSGNTFTIYSILGIKP